MIEILILYVLVNHDFTMYAVQKRIREFFLAYTNPSFGAIKPALVRLEKQGFISSSKIMSGGGKLSIFYAITKTGLQELRRLLLEPLSKNSLQFISDASIKLSCLSFLNTQDRLEVYKDVKINALRHRNDAEKILNDEFTPLTAFQRIVLDNTICTYNNFISMIEGLEQE